MAVAEAQAGKELFEATLQNICKQVLVADAPMKVVIENC